MNDDISKAYFDCIFACVKTCLLAQDYINKETDEQLKDGLLFFLFAFNVDISSFNIKCLSSLSEYIDFDSNKLTEKGCLLKEKLEKKINHHSDILRFNGVSIYDLFQDINCMSKLLKFWQSV